MFGKAALRNPRSPCRECPDRSSQLEVRDDGHLIFDRLERFKNRRQLAERALALRCPASRSHPIGMYTKPSRRTGLAGVWAKAVIAGNHRIEQRQRQHALPPFRNVRLDSAFFIMIISISSSETARS